MRVAAIPVGVQTCRLSVRSATSLVTAEGATTLRWSWRVPAAARAGRYRIVVSCDGATRSAAVRVRAGGSRGSRVRRLARAPIRATVDRADVPLPAAPATRSPAADSSAPAPAPTEPDAACTRLQFGVHSAPAPEAGSERIDTLERLLKRRISIVLWYQHWAGWGPQVEADWIRAAADGGRLPLLTWEPWRPDAVEQPEFRLERIAAGAFDDYIRRWASALRDLGPIYLRPMHEMNGDWYPWAGTVNGNSAADYRAAWIRMHRIFERAGAHNVRWVWSPYAEDVPARPENEFEHYYPGDAYVDVLALDGYNWGAPSPSSAAGRASSSSSAPRTRVWRASGRSRSGSRRPRQARRAATRPPGWPRCFARPSACPASKPSSGSTSTRSATGG